MLKPHFVWLDQHPNTYWLIALGPTLLLFSKIGRLVWRESRNPEAASSRAMLGDALVLLLFLLAWRWPFLLVTTGLNPDESQHIAGALTLTHDPVFWRSVDGNTSGPLNFYALLPLHWLGLPLGYFSARLTGLLLVWGALLACLRTLTGTFGRSAAWLGVLPAAAFFATVTHPDWLHYSTEHLPLLLIAVPFWLLATRQSGDRSRLWAAGFIAGTAAWAKLQAAPLALVLIAWGCWQVLREPADSFKLRLRRTAGVGLAALTPTLVAAVVLAATGQIGAAFRRYFISNLDYASRGNNRTMGEALSEIKNLAMIDGRFPLLIGTALAMLLAATLLYLARRTRPPVLFAAGGALTLAAMVAVIVPRREFLHYLLFLPVPLTLWLGVVAGGWWTQLNSARSRGLLAGLLLLTGGLLPVITRCFQPLPFIYGAFAYHWQYPRSSVSVLVHGLTGGEGSLGVWGWANHLYVKTGLRPATRDVLSSWSILPGPQRDYHRAVYLADLRQNRPPVFVDAVGPGAFVFEHRELQAHEIFPELADFIRENYVLVRDVREARIYARKDLAALSDLSPPEVDRLLAQGRPNTRPKILRRPSAPLDKLRRKNIGSQSVMMLLPPTRVEWPLDQDVREVSLHFGFDPEAYERGVSNGAEVILELVRFEQTRRVYHRLLDPAREPRDRGPQAARVTLPPFSPGTFLVLRTASGEFGDNAWDWVYLADLQFRRSPAFLSEQFPGFNRVPDSTRADRSNLLDEGRGPVLQLDAPASLNYTLAGVEQRLQFDYGFRPGAYANGGHTDGATFRVKLQKPDRSIRVLFERLLDPFRHEMDRGLQQIDLPLPKVHDGDRLVVSIDPGPTGNAAWDWTYIRHFSLK